MTPSTSVQIHTSSASSAWPSNRSAVVRAATPQRGRHARRPLAAIKPVTTGMMPWSSSGCRRAAVCSRVASIRGLAFWKLSSVTISSVASMASAGVPHLAQISGQNADAHLLAHAADSVQRARRQLAEHVHGIAQGDVVVDEAQFSARICLALPFRFQQAVDRLVMDLAQLRRRRPCRSRDRPQAPPARHSRSRSVTFTGLEPMPGSDNDESPPSSFVCLQLKRPFPASPARCLPKFHQISLPASSFISSNKKYLFQNIQKRYGQTMLGLSHLPEAHLCCLPELAPFPCGRLLRLHTGRSLHLSG